MEGEWYINFIHSKSQSFVTDKSKKTKFIEKVMGDVVTQLKQQKFNVSARFIMYCFITTVLEAFY